MFRRYWKLFIIIVSLDLFPVACEGLPQLMQSVLAFVSPPASPGLHLLPDSIVPGSRSDWSAEESSRPVRSDSQRLSYNSIPDPEGHLPATSHQSYVNTGITLRHLISPRPPCPLYSPGCCLQISNIPPD